MKFNFLRWEFSICSEMDRGYMLGSSGNNIEKMKAGAFRADLKQIDYDVVEGALTAFKEGKKENFRALLTMQEQMNCAGVFSVEVAARSHYLAYAILYHKWNKNTVRDEMALAVPDHADRQEIYAQALTFASGQKNVVTTLINVGMEVKEDTLPLQYAASVGNRIAVDVLYKNGADFEKATANWSSMFILSEGTLNAYKAVCLDLPQTVRDLEAEQKSCRAGGALNDALRGEVVALDEQVVALENRHAEITSWRKGGNSGFKSN